MKNFYIKLMQSSKAIAFVMMTMLLSFVADAQTITINSVTTGPYYTYGDIDVDYTAAGYPAGTTFYLVVDRNNNGFLDAEDDAEDYVLASSTSLTGVLEGEIPNMTGNLNFYVVAGEDGSLGEVVTEFSETAANLTTSGTVSFAYPLSMDQDMTERSIETPDYDLTSDDYYILVLDVDATDVVPANDLVVEVSQDNGATYSALTDQQGNNSFSASNGELIFALSQTLNTTNVRFRISQNNGASIAAATETWTLTSADVIEYSGTFVQYNEEFTGTLSINAPTFTINAETYDTYIGEDVEVDYSALGFTSGATYYLYNGTILDPENRTIFDTDVSVNSILASTWPLDMGDQNVDVRIAGIYGNIDEPLMEFENSDLTITGSSSSAFSYQFSDEGVRSARTDALDLSGEDYVTFSVTANPVGTFSTDNAILVQYSTDGSTWVDLEDDNGVDEITSDTETTYEYTLPNAAKTSSTRIRVRQKAINLSAFSSYWFLSDMRIAFYTVGADQFVSNPFVTNYSVTVSSIEDADDAVISGGTAYPGDEITVTADAAGFDVNSEDYTVLINNTFLLDNEDVSIDGVTDEIVITGNIPTDVEYANASDIEIKIYDGDQPLVAVNENVFGDYNEEEDITVVGDDEVTDGDTKVEFNLAGDRSLTTPEFEIASTDDLTLSFFLNRTNSVRSPSGTEVVVEFSTDGTTFTEIQSFSINEAGQAGETYELDNTVLPSGMASTTTSIRFRQSSNNGLDLDAWELQSITLMGGTNVSDPGYINYVGLTLDILEPAIAFTAIDNANLDLYPSSDLDIEFDVTGEFPTGTTFELLLEREFDGTISFGDFTALGTHSVTIPAVVAGTYDLVLQASHEEVESNTVELVVGEVMITNISITSPDAITDGSDEIVYAGNAIDITYDVVGNVGTGAVLNLEIYDNATDEYMFIVEDEPIDGTISATLPIGIDYNSNDADFRLSITNGNLSSFDVSIDEYWDTDQDAADEYFPLDLREGAYSSGFNYFLFQDGMRSAVSVPLDFTDGGRVRIDLFSSWYDHDEDINLEYSLDDGETWENIATETMTNNSQIFPTAIDMPEEAWTDNVRIRFINTEVYTASSLDNGLRLEGLEVENFYLVPITEEEFTLQPDLILEELSVSQSTLEDTDFILGEEFVVEYNAEGPFPSDVDFAIVLEQSGKYITLAETDQTGAVQQTVNIPSFPFEDTNLAYNLKVVPFVKVGANDEFRAAAETEDLENEDDFLVIEGRSPIGTGASGFYDFEFSRAGSRSLLTRAIDLEDFGSAKLEFEFTWTDPDFSSLLTLPELQVSIDGTDFETLEVTDALYEAEGLVYPNGFYSVDIPEEYLTAETHFRWIQKLNLGEEKDNWRVYDIDIVKGETNELNDQIYLPFNNPQSINISLPSKDNYVWEQSDVSDAAFNGETFNYNWDFDPEDLDESNFPEGTEYVFTINVTDPETGEDIVIGSTSMLGSNFEASIPLFVENGTYDVLLTATITDGEEEYFLFEDEDVADLDIFLKAITINYAGDENAVIYAGSTVTFGIEVENDESTTSDFSTFNSNLILEYGGDDWLLASQTGIGDISADLPPFVNGNEIDFRVELSENGAIGDVGAVLDESVIGTLENDADNFIAGDVFTFSYVDFESTSGRGVVTTRDFEVGELDDALLFEFDITFNQIPEDLTADQNIIFEFSTDGGATYTELGSFPETDAEMTLSNETFGFEVTSDMKTNATRLRWRQEEIKGTFRVEEIGFTFAEALPFDYVGTDIDISQQALLISSIDTEEACMADDITLSYEIRGRFGADNLIRAYYRDENFSTGLVDGFEFNVTEGTGTMAINVPSDVLNNSDVNEDFEFRLYTNDQTFSDIGQGFNFYGSYSEQKVEIVAPVNADASFNLPSQTLCEAEEVIVTINNLQNYSTYELFNVEDATVLGTLVYDPEVGDNEINLGILTESVEIGMTVMSSTSSGNLTCNTITSSYTDMLEVNENYELYIYDYDLNPQDELVTVGDSKTICEDASSRVLLRVYRPDGSLKTNGVEWFRDDLNTPVSTSYFINNNTLSEAGSYFARVTDGSCTYTTLSYIIENVDAPTVPEITPTGDLGICDGDGEVILEATSGFTYYKWNTGETTQSITVDQEGNYFVDVSNVPFEVGCSARSETVELESTYSQEFTIKSSSRDAFLLGDETVVDCDETTIQFYNEEYTSLQTANGGLYTAYRDGAAFKTGTGNSMTIDQSGEYYFEWTNDALNGVCTTTSPTITINISESIEDMPVVTVVSGDLNFCEGEGEVVLEAPEGFAYYKWSTGETTRSITREVAGTVTVQVSNVPFDAGCASPSSAPIVIETSNLPDFVVSTDNSNPQPDDYLFDGAQYSECDDFRLYFYDLDASTSPRNDNGEVVINRGGDFYASTQNTSYLFEESGEYSIEWVSSDLSSTCSASGGSFSLTITESIETAPTISTTDDLTFCEGSTATLTAEAGFNFYRWYNGTSVINTNSSTLVVDSSGDYTVEVSNTPFTVGCGSPRSNGIRVTVYNDPNMNLETNISGSALSDGEVIDVCSDDGFVLRADNTGGNPVTWYLDGVALPGSSNNTGNTSRSDYEPTVSGVYFAEVTVGGSDVADQCVYRTPSVTVNVSQKLDVASIATPANTTFCEGEVDVTLTATGPADASVFRWYRSNVNSSSFSAITDGTGNGNTIQVTGEGKYYVTVGETDGCESDPSNVITIESQTLANPNISVTTFDANCSNGGVTVQLSSTNAETVYQLINQETGANVGSPKTGSTSDPVYVQLTGVTESFGVLVQASYADGTGCPQTSTGSRGTVTPDNVMLELDGNELVAVINGSFIDYTWFRDGVELKNVTGTSLRITDASVYSIEVVFVGGCSVTSNSIDLTNESAGAGGGAGGIQGSAYPNPASGVVNVAIEGENMGDYDISIMTLSGQLMMSKTLSKEDEDFVEQLDIQSLQPGIYNLLIRKGNETKSMRIVKTQ